MKSAFRTGPAVTGCGMAGRSPGNSGGAAAIQPSSQPALRKDFIFVRLHLAAARGTGEEAIPSPRAAPVPCARPKDRILACFHFFNFFFSSPNSTSNTVAFTYSLAPWLPRNLSGRPAGTARVHRSDAEEETPGPSSGEGRAAGRLRAGSSPSSAAAAAGMLRSAASGGQRPLQLGGSASGVQGLRQPAGAPGPRSPKHRRPGAFISHPVLFPQVHRLRPPSPSSSPASPRITTDRSPLSLSLFLSRLKLSPRRKQHGGAARPAFHRPGNAAAGALKTKRRTVTFHTAPFPPRAE